MEKKKKKAGFLAKFLIFYPCHPPSSPSTESIQPWRSHPKRMACFAVTLFFLLWFVFGVFLGIAFQQRSKTSPEKKDHLSSSHPCPFAASGWALRCQPQPCCVPVPAVVPSQEGPGKPGLETSPVMDFAAIPWSLPFAATGPISRQGLDGLHRSGSDPLKRGAGQTPTEPAARGESRETGTGISPPIS